jgi:hypothetical protein
LSDVEAAQGDEIAGLLNPGLLGFDLLAHRIGKSVILPALAGGVTNLDRNLREFDAVGIDRFPQGAIQLFDHLVGGGKLSKRLLRAISIEVGDRRPNRLMMKELLVNHGQHIIGRQGLVASHQIFDLKSAVNAYCVERCNNPLNS